MNKLQLSETDICDQFITPALQQAGWSLQRHILRADYVLFHKPNLPLAVAEAKDARHAVGAGMPQASLSSEPC